MAVFYLPIAFIFLPLFVAVLLYLDFLLPSQYQALAPFFVVLERRKFLRNVRTASCYWLPAVVYSIQSQLVTLNTTIYVRFLPRSQLLLFKLPSAHPSDSATARHLFQDCKSVRDIDQGILSCA